MRARVIKKIEMSEESDAELLTRYTLVDMEVLKNMSVAPLYHGNICNVQNGPHAFTVCSSQDLRMRFQLLPKSQQEFTLRLLMQKSHATQDDEEDEDDEDDDAIASAGDAPHGARALETKGDIPGTRLKGRVPEEEKSTSMLMIEEYEKWRKGNEVQQLHQRLEQLFTKIFSVGDAVIGQRPQSIPFATPKDWNYEMASDVTSMAFLCFTNLQKSCGQGRAKSGVICKAAKRCFRYAETVQEYGRELSKKYEFVLAKKRATNDCSDTKFTLFKKFHLHKQSWYCKKIPRNVREIVFNRLCFFNMPDERFVLKQKE